MRIDTGISQTYIQQRQPTSNPTPVATQARSSAQESTDEAQPLNKVDFTNMTNQELVDWMNGEVKAGRMTLDESRPFIFMAMSIPIDGELTNTIDNTTRHNFIDKIRGGIERAKSLGDDGTLALLETAAEMVQKYQIQSGSIDTRV
ncbi:hypothetical protein ABMA57_08765 [Saccharospirillum sp. HFRX-1]|uniref:hypothetical protein n=1 Tax=unclassified Saccharospirillum TaxID=2633430 RepID=UPI0037203C2E